MKYEYSGRTDIGLEREVNQDSLGVANPKWGSIFIVADGFGHKEGGEFASKATVDIFLKNFKKQNPLNIKQFILETFEEANNHIYFNKVSQFDNSMMGCTAVIIITQEEDAHIAHIGDSRAYLIREDEISKLTKDHSYVQKLIDKGELLPEKAKFHPKRHVLRKALGSHRGVRPDYVTFKILPNDKFVLCSDGVWGFLPKKLLLEDVLNTEISKATLDVIEHVKKNMGSDNITVQIISFI